MIRIGYRELKKWSEEQADDDVAGTVGSGALCPIAEYIRDNGGFAQFVSPERISYRSHEEGCVERRPTEFAKLVIGKVDRSLLHFVTPRIHTITIGQFKEILDEAKAEVS